MTKEEMQKLERAIEEITMRARDFGLDFYEMRYEVCPSEIIYTFGAYGMPTRFSHWSFGNVNNQKDEKRAAVRWPILFLLSCLGRSRHDR